MAEIAFILLCHKDPAGIVAQALRLTAAGDNIAIHFDARAPKADYDRIRAALADNPRVAFAARRIKCGWGEWSLVEASLLAVRAAYDAFPEATHFYMLSGDCMPIKSAEYVKDFLDRDDLDYVEAFDFFKSDWIKTGIKEERLIYRHWFNERTHKWWFYTSMDLQRRFGLARKIPQGLDIQIGSQWWCLRRSTIGAILSFCDTNPAVIRFFATTWIPDETMFQTLVRHLIPDREIRTRTLTFLMFTDYGMPLTFYNDHYDMLISQDYLFARKISPHAADLKERLGQMYQSRGVRFPISNEGRTLLTFLRDRGRNGRRFAPRFWEAETSLGRERRLTLVVCKKWHVAKRFTDRASEVLGVPRLHYLFNEVGTELPPLGGIETTLEKRERHRRALLRMLFDYYDTRHLMICIDPSNLDLIRDVVADRARVDIIDLECVFDDDYLVGHAQRVGLAGPSTPVETMDRLMPVIRYDFRYESERIRDADFPNFRRLHETNTAEENAEILAELLDIPRDTALEITSMHYLFMD
ncbi:DUF5928 domain-containing protein [Falsirhodobacter algicola]|uniref:Peptide O-xylosyltransferase n=1 Tax=Falsirhodobacter algicola TaxID=2692330 RepID=A0A8J8MUD4_9RHOB|nr:DUF5928 domain-containing protein [Falsirhodobacter algicola]QUS36622.1 glycosyl transferase [Falsirhodobacter algicola]